MKLRDIVGLHLVLAILCVGLYLALAIVCEAETENDRKSDQNSEIGKESMWCNQSGYENLSWVDKVLQSDLENPLLAQGHDEMQSHRKLLIGVTVHLKRANWYRED